jgi:hypothetical protein
MQKCGADYLERERMKLLTDEEWDTEMEEMALSLAELKLEGEYKKAWKEGRLLYTYEPEEDKIFWWREGEDEPINPTSDADRLLASTPLGRTSLMLRGDKLTN